MKCGTASPGGGVLGDDTVGEETSEEADNGGVSSTTSETIFNGLTGVVKLISR